jgi:hypothetical protein
VAGTGEVGTVAVVAGGEAGGGATAFSAAAANAFVLKADTDRSVRPTPSVEATLRYLSLMPLGARKFA